MAGPEREPVQSMTGVGTAAGATALGDLAVETRSVNARGLIVKFRLDGACQGLESDIERRIRARVRRGTVTVVMEVAQGGSTGTVIDAALARRAHEELCELADGLGLTERPGLAELLLVPGVLAAAGTTRSRISQEPPADVAALIDGALDRLVEHRTREGSATRELLLGELDRLGALREAIAARAPEVVADHRERLLKRVNEFLEGRGRVMDDQDVLREVALFADRADITEELDRLTVHAGHARELLAAGGLVGRRLEFLLQEILREVNTLGSKSPDVSIAESVVAMKSAVDKMKEQTANLE